MFRFFCCSQDEEKSVDTGPKFFSRYNLADTVIELNKLYAKVITETQPTSKETIQRKIEAEDFDKEFSATPISRSVFS